MHNLYESIDAVYIVTDLASGGELFQQLLKKGTYTEKDASNLTRQMLEGLQYLHERDVSQGRSSNLADLVINCSVLDCSPRYEARERTFPSSR